MATHRFGIMPGPPETGRRYEQYEPQKYGVIAVDDDDLMAAAERIETIVVCWHSPDVKGKGLAWFGITLIQPESIGAFIDAIENLPDLAELKALLQRALDENRWVIHYGL